MYIYVKPGQRRSCAVFGRTAIVSILRSLPNAPDSWLCQEIATGRYLVLNESAIGEVLAPSVGADASGTDDGP